MVQVWAERESTDPEEAFNVLVTSVEDAPLESLVVDHAILPDYHGRLHWTVGGVQEISGGEPFDLVVIVCEDPSDTNAAIALARACGRRREVTIVLTSSPWTGARLRTDEGLIVTVLGEDACSNLLLLEHALLAPVFADGLVCADLADILTVLAAGSDAILLSGEGESPGEAIAVLAAAALSVSGSKWFSVSGSLSSPRVVTRADYHAFVDLASSRTRPEAMRVLALPIHTSTVAVASLLIVTQSSTSSVGIA